MFIANLLILIVKIRSDQITPSLNELRIGVAQEGDSIKQGSCNIFTS